MIEILITIAIVIIGLWGLMDVQARLQVSEMESYQRTQALMLVNDMANRISANRSSSTAYVTTTPTGFGATCPTTATTVAEVDEREWCNALQGAAEQAGGVGVGSLVGGRGCVESVGTGGVTEYRVTVVWQGLTPIAAPPSSIACGLNLYNLPTGSSCASNADACRRYVTTLVRIADLTDL